MRFFRYSAILILLVVAAGCADSRVFYLPNPQVYEAQHHDKSLAVLTLVDVRPQKEIINDITNATQDLICLDYIPAAISKSISDDLAMSNVFKSVVYIRDAADMSEGTDLILKGEIRHFFGQYRERWREPLWFISPVILAPFYIPFEYSDQYLEIYLQVIDAKTSEALWETTLKRKWAYGPMTAWGFFQGTPLLYKTLCRRLRTQMASAIWDLDQKLLPPEKPVATGLIDVEDEKQE